MSAAPAAIRCEGVTKAFGTRKAVDDLSLELPRGAFLSVFGPNGAGKTTLLRMIATLARPSAGRIEVEGIDAKEEPDRAREAIGLISHNPMLYPDLTAEENLLLYARLYGVRDPGARVIELLDAVGLKHRRLDRVRTFSRGMTQREENLLLYARLYGVRDPGARVIELLDAVGLKHRRLDRVRTFSRGMTQRVSIARALVNDPAVVLLDEPYSGLDPHAIEVFDDLIASVRQDRTFVMVSHDLEKGLRLADHVLVMARGRAVAFGPKDELDEAEFRALYRSTVGMGVA